MQCGVRSTLSQNVRCCSQQPCTRRPWPCIPVLMPVHRPAACQDIAPPAGTGGPLLSPSPSAVNPAQSAIEALMPNNPAVGEVGALLNAVGRRLTAVRAAPVPCAQCLKSTTPDGPVARVVNWLLDRAMTPLLRSQ